MALVAFFDESGHSSDSDFVTVAGLVADDHVWHDFNRAWTEANLAADVGAFHAREFAHSRGSFASWKGDEARRRRYMNSLLQAIRSARPTPVAAIADAEEARKLPEMARRRMRDPYCHCLQAAMRAAAIVAMDRPRHDRVQMNVAKSSERTGDVQKLWLFSSDTLDYKHRIGPLHLGDAREMPGLQAADLWAYELLRETRRVSAGRSTQARYPWHLFEWLMFPAPMVRFFGGRELAAIYGASG